MSKKSPATTSPAKAAKPAKTNGELSQEQLDKAAGGLIYDGGGGPYNPIIRKRP